MTTLLQALFALWTTPAIRERSSTPTSEQDVDATVEPRADIDRPGRGPGDFLREAEALFLQPTRGDALRRLSSDLEAQFRAALLTSPACMLPSHNHQLPTRLEHGQYLALDVGGSTLRVALVQLGGAADGHASGGASSIVRLDSFKIDGAVKSLEGMAFFDWMAARIVETLAQAPHADSTAEKPLLMGLAWSFPIEQTSLKGGKLQGMGKGLLAANGLLGHDLGAIIHTACRARGLHIELAAILNDSTAALLAHAYADPATRFGLILGTGVNIAVHLPLAAVGRAKLRHHRHHHDKTHVVVNTELGMFGGGGGGGGDGILPLTRWDRLLRAAHPKPDFQPLEHLVSGCYLGEVCRLALVEAIARGELLGGVVPPSLLQPYALDTETISLIEADTSPSLHASQHTFHARHPSAAPPTPADMAFIRALAALVSRRSSAIVAAALVALWRVKTAAEDDEHEHSSDVMVVAFNGSVIENYPRYRHNCQDYIDELIGGGGGGGGGGAMRLVGAKESSLVGAAVALACLDEDGV